jgi:hypothetical protein
VWATETAPVIPWEFPIFTQRTPSVAAVEEPFPNRTNAKLTVIPKTVNRKKFDLFISLYSFL